MKNQIVVIKPHRKDGLWVFSDDRVGLVDEPFVSGADRLIDIMSMHIPGATDGFNLVFSSAWFPDHQHTFDRQQHEGGGVWYKHRHSALQGWLCPALFLYFESAPECLYVKCEPFKE